MEHALIIGHEGEQSRAAVDALWEAGYRSIFRADDMDELPSLLSFAPPALVLVLPGTPVLSMAELRRLERQIDAPIIVARSDVAKALKCLGPMVEEELSARVGHFRAVPCARVATATLSLAA